MKTSQTTEEESGETTSPPPLPGRSDGHWVAVAAAITSLGHVMLEPERKYEHHRKSFEAYWDLIDLVRQKARMAITESGEAKRRSDPGNTKPMEG